MAALYQTIPPAPTWADLGAACDRGLAMAATIPGVTQPGILGTITGWFTGSGQTDATSRGRVQNAVNVLAEVKGQAADAPGLPAAGEAVERVRQACIVLEQEAAGMGFASAKQERNRAELLDEVSNPEAYVDAAKNSALGGFSPLNPNSPTSPPNFLPNLGGWWTKYRVYFFVAAGLLVLVLVAPLIFGAVKAVRT